MFVLGIFVVLALAPVGFSQGGPQGAIAGVVKDSTGATVPGATVTIVNQDTGVTSRTLTTTDDGTFTANLLPVGNYTVTVSMPGFQTANAPNVIVRVATTSNVVITLQVGQISQTINVEGAATPVQLSAPTTGETITDVGELPLPTRNFLNLLALSAGTSSEMEDTSALGRGAVSIVVNGQRPTNNNYQLEGINANDYNLPVFDNVPLPNPQAIKEFKTQTSLYDASQGRNAGGNIQVTMQSGTSHFHGNAFEFFRNNVLNANDLFLNAEGQPRPVLRQNQFGGSLGGPIPVGKDFFFFVNYQGTRAASGISAGTNFSTTIPVLPTDRSAANLARVFFPGGLPAGTSINPVAVAFLNLPASKCPGFNDGKFCIPSLSGTPGLTGTTVNVAQIARSAVGTFTDDQFTLTADKTLTQNNIFSARWFFSDNTALRPLGEAGTLPFGINFPNSNRFLKLGLTSTLSPTRVNNLRFGYNRYTFVQTPDEPITLADVGAVRGNSGTFPGAYEPIIRGGGAFSLGAGVNDNRGTVDNTFVGADDFSWTHGKHTIRFGPEVDRYQLNRFNNFAQRGSVTFQNTTAGAGGVAVPLTGFQNFLLGRISTTQVQSGFSRNYFRATDWAAYAQDDWKVTGRLTVNLGLRWEGMAFAHDKNNILSNFAGLGDNQPGPIHIIHPQDAPGGIGTPGVSSCTMDDCFRWKNFAPRFGFAWDVFGNGSTAIRGGYGIYYDRVSNQALLQTSGGLPFVQVQSAAAFSVTPQNPFPGLLPISAFPLSTDQVIPRLSSFDATGAPIFNSADGTPLSGFFFFPERNFKIPYSQVWNFTVQRRIAQQWVLEVGYVGNHGVRLLGPGRSLDAGQICTTASPCLIPSSVASGVTVPAGTPGTGRNPDGSISITQSTPANVDARVPAQFLGLANNRGFFQENSGFSFYNSLQATISHQFTKDLYFQGAYTFSKTIDNGSGSEFTDELNGLIGLGNLFNPKASKGVADFDRTHRLVISYQYLLPFQRLIPDRGIGRIANGWSWLGLFTLQSGTPFLVADTSALTLQDPQGENGFYLPTLAPGRSLASALTSGNLRQRLGNYVDLSAFTPGGLCVNNQNQVVDSSSPACTGLAAIGAVARNIPVYRGPFQQNYDMSFLKVTKVTEATNIEFRAEFFNIFNHPAFQSPQSAGGSFGNYGIVDVAGGTSAILATVNRPRIIQFALKFNF